jgi:HSP20 family molecular chaperone IbpA
MAKVAITRKDSILDQIQQIRHRIAQRAYELFRQRDGQPGDPVTDWLNAEREIVWRPAVDFRENDGVFSIVVALPDMRAKDISVSASADGVVIEAASTRLFQSVNFRTPIEAAKAKAEYKNGVLTVTVPAVRASQTRPVAVKAA